MFWEFAYVERRTSLSSGGANERGRRESCGWEDEWVMGGVFFFTTKIAKMCIFFSQEKFTTQHLTRSQGPETKKRRKKTNFPLTYTVFPRRYRFLNFAGEKNSVPLVEHGFHVPTILNTCILKWNTLYFFKLFNTLKNCL